MMLETERLLLRPWTEEDAEALFLFASDPHVGPAAGWKPHTSAEDSRTVIRETLHKKGTFAVVPKSFGKPAGSISLMGARTGTESNLTDREDEAELGYWIGRPFWGHGLMTEAAEKILRYGFDGLGLASVWCGYFEGNERSRRVQEKCGFVYRYTKRDIIWFATGEKLTEHISCLTREEWEAGRRCGPGLSAESRA